MYVVLEGVSRIKTEDMIKILGDRIAFTNNLDIDNLMSFSDVNYGGSSIVVISDEAYEGDIREGGTVDYEELGRGQSTGIERFRTPEYDPENPNRTVLQALDNLKVYLNSIGHTDWRIVEVVE